MSGPAAPFSHLSFSPFHPSLFPQSPNPRTLFFFRTNREHVYSIYMSYVQIYMEEIQDLLRPSGDPLQLREDASQGGVYLENVQEVQIRSVEECLQLLQLGERNR
jgi:hypothetical protein